MTLSAIGDAETPAGGSVCIRYVQQMLATALTQDPVVVLKHEKGLRSIGAGDLLGQSTLKSRMRRLRAGVVISRVWLGSEGPLEMREAW